MSANRVSPLLNELHTDLRELKKQKKTLIGGWIEHLGGLKPFEIKSSFGYRHVVEMRSTVTAERLRDLLDGQVVDVSHTDQRKSKVRYQVPVGDYMLLLSFTTNSVDLLMPVYCAWHHRSFLNLWTRLSEWRLRLFCKKRVSSVLPV